MPNSDENKGNKATCILLIVFFQAFCILYGVLSILLKVTHFKGLLTTNIVIVLLLVALYGKIIFSSRFKYLPKYVSGTFLGMFVAAITVIFLNFGH